MRSRLFKGYNVTERGWAGHFIAARNCTFRRNTLVECGDQKVVVSSVGGYISPLTNKMDTIGYHRWYETLAFAGVEQNGYIEADVTKPIEFSSEWEMFAENLDELELRYGSAWENAANKIHDDVVAEIGDKLLKKEILCG